MRRHLATLAVTTAIGVLLSGCSTKGDDTVTARTDTLGVKTDYGVTDSQVTLGIMTDQTTAFKNQGLATTHGNQMWADDVNASGGICGRKIKFDIKDHGYAADKAVALYSELQPKVLGIIQLFGTPPLAALKSQLVADKMLTVPSSLASSSLDAPEVLMVGATYDIEMLNGLAYLREHSLIADGDKIGHIYIDSEYGKNALLGSTAYTFAHNQQLVAVPVSGSDTDMTAAVTQLKSQGITAIMITLTPPAMASVMTQSQAQGLDVPVVGNTPTWDTALLQTPAADALGNYYRVTSQAPFGYHKSDKAKSVAAAYKKTYSETPLDTVNYGYASAMAFGEVLKQACADKDLTRQGLLDAAQKVTVDTDGLSGKLDYSVAGAPATREVYIENADPNAEGGLKVVNPLFAWSEAKSYKAPYQK